MTPNKPLAAIYTRVSTEDQAKQGISMSAQEEALKNAKSVYKGFFKVKGVLRNE